VVGLEGGVHQPDDLGRRHLRPRVLGHEVVDGLVDGGGDLRGPVVALQLRVRLEVRGLLLERAHAGLVGGHRLALLALRLQLLVALLQGVELLLERAHGLGHRRGQGAGLDGLLLDAVQRFLAGEPEALQGRERRLLRQLQVDGGGRRRGPELRQLGFELRRLGLRLATTAAQVLDLLPGPRLGLLAGLWGSLGLVLVLLFVVFFVLLVGAGGLLCSAGGGFLRGDVGVEDLLDGGKAVLGLFDGGGRLFGRHARGIPSGIGAPASGGGGGRGMSAGGPSGGIAPGGG
jgi:hypothetical protein